MMRFFSMGLVGAATLALVACGGRSQPPVAVAREAGNETQAIQQPPPLGALTPRAALYENARAYERHDARGICSYLYGVPDQKACARSERYGLRRVQRYRVRLLRLKRSATSARATVVVTVHVPNKVIRRRLTYTLRSTNGRWFIVSPSDRR